MGYDALASPAKPSVGTPFGFQAQGGAYTDSETGLVLMGYRYYDPNTGRFLTRDPSGTRAAARRVGSNPNVVIYGKG